MEDVNFGPSTKFPINEEIQNIMPLCDKNVEIRTIHNEDELLGDAPHNILHDVTDMVIVSPNTAEDAEDIDTDQEDEVPMFETEEKVTMECKEPIIDTKISPIASDIIAPPSSLKSKRKSFRITSATQPNKTSPSKKLLSRGCRRYSGIYRLLNHETGAPAGESSLYFVPKQEEEISTIEKKMEYTHIVMKMIAYTIDDVATSFYIGRDGGTIGRSQEKNTVYIPADKPMTKVNHAEISYLNGRFYIKNNGIDNATYVRLSPVLRVPKPRSSQRRSCRRPSGNEAKINIDTLWKQANEEEVNSPLGNTFIRHWPLLVGCHFRLGHTEFEVLDTVDESIIKLKALSGKLNGEEFTIHKNVVASIGRSTENTIHTGDGELSRRHAIIEYYDYQFFLCDVGSTNGTYMKLVGPYSKPYCLAYGDQLLLSQTSLSINRFDFGVYASEGARKEMEDTHCTVQDMGVENLTALGYGPQTFFGVFDGHGGDLSSKYLMEHLHENISTELSNEFSDEVLQENLSEDEIERRIAECLKTAFEKTDKNLLKDLAKNRSGSTATTVLIANKTIFSANLGDSRTVLCRNGEKERLSDDHKPSRPDEAKRIRNIGGFIISGRIMGELAVSRAFGDFDFKIYDKNVTARADGQSDIMNPCDTLRGPLVIATPEVNIIRITDDAEFLLLASDGLFDVYDDEVAVKFIRNKLRDVKDTQRVVQELVLDAINNLGSRDNVTAIVILLK